MPPIRFTHRSPLYVKLLEKTEARLAARPGDYIEGSIMGCLAECVLECGLMGAYQPPSAFCRIPFYSQSRAIRDSSVDGVTVDVVAATAWGHNSTWQTGKNSKETLFSRGSHEKVLPGSLWRGLLDRLGNEMRCPTLGGLRATSGGQQPAEALGGEQPAGVEQRMPRLYKKAADPSVVANPIPRSSLEPACVDAASSQSTTGSLIPSSWQNSMCISPTMTCWDHSHVRRMCLIEKLLGTGTFGKVYSGQLREKPQRLL